MSEPAIPDFVHLHAHSEFSLLDGIGTCKERAKRTAAIGQSALAITDHGTMAGVLYHIEACKEHGIRPIVGMEAYFRPDIAKDRADKDQYGYTHLVLLAKNEEGFRSLLRITSESHDADHFYQKPSVDWELLERNSEGLIASSSCVSGLLPKLLVKGASSTEQRDYISRMQGLFGEDFFFEIQPHDFDEQRFVNLELASLAVKHGIPLVATVDSHYPHEDWSETQDVAVMIATNSSFGKRKKADEEGTADYLQFSGDTFWLMDSQEVFDTFDSFHNPLGERAILEAIGNADLIAARCEDYEISKAPKVPRITRSALEAERIIRGWVREGLERIGKLDDQLYLDRIEQELEVMRRNKVLDYFVIVGRGVRWAKGLDPDEQPPGGPIRVGPGRGSAAGSLVCYLSRITGLDPIGYDLLFERFMNEYRTELPDIDLDFQHSRRDEVKDYYRRTFGEDHVVDVAAFQTFGLKAALQSSARVFDVPYDEFMAVTKTIQEHPSSTATLSDLVVVNPDLRAFSLNHPEVWKHALRLEGGMKATSRHPAAVIVTDKPAKEYIPLMRGSDGRTVTQWAERADFQVISSYGFLKIDVLSTDSLSAQQTVIDLVRDRHGIELDYEDPNQFPVVATPGSAEDDVVELFRTGPWLGIFQFSSYGITQLLKDISPDKFDDVIAANTLYRPGTMPVMEEFCDRKHGRSDVVIWHDDVRPFMERSYGLMIYQEQVMQICQVLGGFDKGTSNLVLKALTKWHGSRGTKQKGAVKIAEYRGTFVEGCRAKGLDKKTADGIWDSILALTKYVFNRCAHGRTRVTLPDGTQMALSRAYKEQPAEIMAMWPDGSVRPHRVTRIVRTGKKPTYRVATKFRSFIGTLEHRLLTTEGYREIRELRPGMELIVDERWTPEDRKRRSSSLKMYNESPERLERDRRASERMREYQASRDPQELVDHMRRMHEIYPEMKRAGIAAMQERIKWLWVNDPEWKRNQIEGMVKRVRKLYDTGPGWGECSFASDGTFCASRAERAMCEWLIELGIEFEAHRVLPSGRICDFYFDGRYWEMDGMDRESSYFEEKYGDLPFVVVTPEDFKLVIERELQAGHVVNGDPIVSIEYYEDAMTYDVEMDPDGPLNWIANRVVSHNSHSAGYALQAYFDAWELLRYPLEFYASLLTHEPKKVPKAIRDARLKGIQVLPPDVNASGAGFTLDGNSIRFGLQAIKGVADAGIAEILAKRPFSSLEDFEERTEKRRCNSRVRTALIESGAMDSIGQRSDWQLAQKGNAEKQLLGFALSTRTDVEKHSKLLDDYALTDEAASELEKDSEVFVAGEVVKCKEHVDKSGGLMAFLGVEHGGVEREVIVFADTYGRNQHRMGVGAAIVVKGRWDEGKVIADHAVSAAELAKSLKEAS